MGRPLGDLQGWKGTVFIHRGDVEGIVEGWREYLASGEPLLHETRIQRADGEYRWMLLHKVARRDGPGQTLVRKGAVTNIDTTASALLPLIPRANVGTNEFVSSPVELLRAALMDAGTGRWEHLFQETESAS